MKTYLFPIVGLRYNDYADRLDELCEYAPGRSVELTLERDNEAEPWAVLATLDGAKLGHVRSGKDCERARTGIFFSQSDRLTGCVKRVGRSPWVAYVEVECTVDERFSFYTNYNDIITLLEGLDYDGPLLPVSNWEKKLHAVADKLEDWTTRQRPWDDEMAEALESFGVEGWRDWSREMFEQRERILQALRAEGAPAGYAAASDRLQKSIDKLGRPEKVRPQMMELRRLAASHATDKLFAGCEDSLERWVALLPVIIVKWLMRDAEMLLTKIRYHKLSAEDLRKVRTLIVLWLRQQAREAAPMSKEESKEAVEVVEVKEEKEEKAAPAYPVLTAAQKKVIKKAFVQESAFVFERVQRAKENCVRDASLFFLMVTCKAHGLVKESALPIDFVRALSVWGLVEAADDKAVERKSNSICAKASVCKLHNQYRKWPEGKARTFCMALADALGEDIPYKYK